MKDNDFLDLLEIRELPASRFVQTDHQDVFSLAIWPLKRIMLRNFQVVSV
jgi:hypothetical protein